MAKRERHVYPTDRIPHLWANQTQGDARNPQGNLYFRGDTIYSYRDGYPIGKLFTNGTGEKCVLIQEDRYSVTTAGHISAVRWATRHMTCFTVPYLSHDLEKNVSWYVAQSRERWEKAQRARSNAGDLLDEAEALSAHCENYCKFFNFPYPKAEFDFLPTGDVRDVFMDRATVAEQKQREINRKARATRQAKRQAEWAEYEERRKQEEENAKRELPEKIARWRAGEYVRFGYGSVEAEVPTMLRIKGDEVQTSRGAAVPVTHAIRGLKMVRKVKESGVEYRRNGHTLHLGPYSVDRISADGTLYAGCHVIHWDEIDRIAPELERWRAEHDNGNSIDSADGDGNSDGPEVVGPSAVESGSGSQGGGVGAGIPGGGTVEG